MIRDQYVEDVLHIDSHPSLVWFHTFHGTLPEVISGLEMMFELRGIQCHNFSGEASCVVHSIGGRFGCLLLVAFSV